MIETYEDFERNIKISAKEILMETNEDREDLIEATAVHFTLDGDLDFIRMIGRKNIDLVNRADHDLCDRLDERPSFSDMIGAMCFRIYEVALREEIERISI